MKWVSLFVVVATLGCAQNNASDPSRGDQPSPSRSAAEPEIYEAVFRYQFDHNASALQKGAARFCLSLPGERMPDANFLSRFEGNSPPAVAADQCSRGSRKDLFFRIQKLDWRKDHEVWVRGGYWEGNLSSSTEYFRVLFESGEWVVKGARTEVMS